MSETSPNPRVAPDGRPRRRPPAWAARLFNRPVLTLAGTRWLPLYGVITHRGRRSGKIFRTPVVVRPTQNGVAVPMPWGEGTDWYRNIRAAGECVMRWKGRDYRFTSFEVLDVAEAGAAFGVFERAVMRRVRIRQFLRLRHGGA